MSKNKVIIIKETIKESIITDFFSMLFLSIAMYVNYFFCQNSKIMSGFIILIFLSLLKKIATYREHIYSIDRAISELKKMKGEL